MAIKTFASGEILTASDTNTYLANAGLVYVTSTTIGTNVTSVTISNCFTTTYDSYRIVLDNTVCSIESNAIFMKFNNSAGSTYSTGAAYMSYAVGTVVTYVSHNTTTGIWVGLSDNVNSSSSFVADVMTPYKTVQTHVTAQYANNAIWGTSGGRDSNAASQTGFTLSFGGVTFTGGKIIVYGYRIA